MRRIGESYVARDAVVVGDIVLSPGVNIWHGCILRGDLSRITLGPNANIQDGTIIHTDHDEPLTVGEDVVVGHRAVLHGVFIGRGTLVGMGAILLARSEVGDECVIAAGALVGEGKKIPPRSVVMGVPGKVVRQVTDEEAARVRQTAKHYLEMAVRHAAGEFPPPWDSEGRP
jgi:carbonic anhydrase/acetyltransferase-like protein (isoleucine patch superfamily)